MAMSSVLIIEDDEVIGKSMASHLSAAGFQPTWVTNGVAGLARLRYERPDVCVVDLMLPALDGWELIEAARAHGIGTPVIVVSARGSEDDRVQTLELGADDYMVKPFALAELSARLRALLRRGAPRESVLRLRDLEMNTVRRTVRRDGRLIELKPKEYALLEFLMRNTDRPVTKSLIIEHVWDIHFDSISNVVEVHISSLRNKIDRRFSVPLIHTIRGVGYMLTDTAPR